MFFLQTNSHGLNTIEVISFISSIASLILALLSIWLSIKFYKMSTEASNKTNEAAKDIDASVKRLETLFEKIYSDTFGMMKDTYSDMRKHMFKNEETKTGGVKPDKD